MYSVFNSTFEISLRILILMDEFGTAQSLGRLYIADFITTYGRAFGITEKSINGDNQFMFSEFASRRELVRGALKELVLDGYVLPIRSNRGFSYRINDKGKEFSKLLDSEYAIEYRQAAKAALAYMGNRTQKSITDEINDMSMKSIQRRE